MKHLYIHVHSRSLLLKSLKLSHSRSMLDLFSVYLRNTICFMIFYDIQRDIGDQMFCVFSKTFVDPCLDQTLFTKALALQNLLAVIGPYPHDICSQMKALSKLKVQQHQPLLPLLDPVGLTANIFSANLHFPIAKPSSKQYIFRNDSLFIKLK